MAKKRVKKRTEKVDGLGPDDIRKIRTAIRKVWHWSYARKLVVKRATGKDGFPFCEKCRSKVPRHYIDHIKKVGDVDGGFIARLFVSSKGLQALCKACHDAKTKAERTIDLGF